MPVAQLIMVMIHSCLSPFCWRGFFSEEYCETSNFLCLEGDDQDH